jgi:hypothetical protein
LDPQWFAWRPGNFEIKRFGGLALFLAGEHLEMLTYPTIIVNEGWAMPQQLLSFALPALTRLALCDKPLSPHFHLSFIPLNLFQVNHLGRAGFCPTSVHGGPGDILINQNVCLGHRTAFAFRGF